MVPAYPLLAWLMLLPLCSLELGDDDNRPEMTLTSFDGRQSKGGTWVSTKIVMFFNSFLKSLTFKM